MSPGVLTSLLKANTTAWYWPPLASDKPVNVRVRASPPTVAYCALLGRPPFDGVTPESILARQTTDDLPLLHTSRGEVPRELEEVLRKAMRGEPAARYASAQEFRRAVLKAQGFLRRLVVFLRGD